MKLELLLAIAAIVIAVFNRPLEILWDKIFGIKKDTTKSIVSNFFHYSRYVLPILGMVHAYYRLPLDKFYIMVTAFFMSALVLSYLFDKTSNDRKWLAKWNKELEIRNRLLDNRKSATQKTNA